MREATYGTHALGGAPRATGCDRRPTLPVTGSQKLLKVIKNPMTDHLPPDTRIVLLSVTGRLVDLNKYVPTMPTHVPICFVVGSMAHGKASGIFFECWLLGVR